MESFNTAQLMVPVMQFMLLLAAITIMLLFGRAKMALLVNYGFLLYWGYFSNAGLVDAVEKVDMFKPIYMGFGLGIVLFAVVGFILQSK